MPTRRRTAPAAAPRAAYHHGDLARALVDAATQLVERSGPAALTLREAARLAGVSVAAPYRHFADREALLASVLTEGFDELADATDQARVTALSTSGALAALRAVGLAYVAFAARRPSIYRLMFGPACDKAAHPGLMAAGHRALGVLVQAVRDAQAAGQVRPAPPEVVALAGWSLCHGLASLHVDGLLASSLAVPVEQAAQWLVEMLLVGAAQQVSSGSAPAAPRRR